MKQAMGEAARFVIGEHDFTSFAAADPDRTRRIQEANGDEDGPSNLRTIFSSEFRREGTELIYEVRGNGFLHHMVRNLVGTFLLVGKGSLAPPTLFQFWNRETALLPDRPRPQAVSTW